MRRTFGKAVSHLILRNKHNLIRDFQEEIECYLGVKKITEILKNGDYSTNFRENLLSVYSELMKKGMVHKKELSILNAWFVDIERIM